MPIRLNEVDPNAPGLKQEWYFGPRPHFMRSAAYDVLARELRGYVRDEIRGRSFLIAAHRGVGKTSLVLRAVEDLDRESLLSAAEGTFLPGTGSRGGRPTPQRPLLVKLHGSALISLQKPTEPLADGAVPKASAETAPPDGAAPKASAETAPLAGAVPKASAETALQQIAIALYRALADEIARSFALHAIEACRHPARADLPEMAAQLRLDVDLAPDPAVLRGYWARTGRLASGVLWPGTVGNELSADGAADRGLREIVAVVTANQAFQVCVGRVEASQSAKGSAERSARMEFATRLDAKDAVNKLFGLTAGALVGGTLFQAAGAPAAAAAGLGTALLSTVALGWAGERRQRSERSTDYTFIIDSSLQTLDRDLPKVIDRVREAGLAPVFLIDELDKLDAPGESIEEIVRRLKSLTTDYGFFCFLTDRPYYDEIEASLRATAYPKQHTLFSHRLMLVYRPAEMALYVRTLLTIEQEKPLFDATAAWVLTCVVLHRARLNAMDVKRELVRLCRDDGTLRIDSAELMADASYLVPMAVQLAIEHTLRQADISARIETDNAFAQLALDVLYMISRAWENGKDRLVIDEITVRRDLIDRGSIDAEEAAARAEDIATLTAKALRLARLLTFFPGINTAINGEFIERGLPSPPPLPPFASPIDSENAKLATLLSLLISIPAVAAGLLREADATEPVGTFYFLFDRYAVAYMGWDKTFEAVCDGKKQFDELRGALAAAGMSLAGLVASGVLPTNLDPVALEQIAERLRPIRDIAALQLALREDIDRLAGLTSALRERRRAIVGIVALAARVMQDVRSPRPASAPQASAPAAQSTPASATPALAPPASAPLALSPDLMALTAIDRMLGLAPLVAVLSAPPGPAPPLQSLKSPNSSVIAALLARPNAAPGEATPGEATPGDATMTWHDEITAEFTRQTGHLAEVTAAPDPWQDRLAHWVLQHARPVDPPIRYNDIVQAAAGKFPAFYLRPDFDTMTITEWSRYTNAAYNYPDTWAFAAGLRALGFGQRVLQAAEGGRFAEGAPPDKPGLWLVFAPKAEIVGPPDPAAIPMVFIPDRDETDYKDLEEWLIENEALAFKTRKED